jgi:hypothetical protein
MSPTNRPVWPQFADSKSKLHDHYDSRGIRWQPENDAYSTALQWIRFVHPNDT